MQNILNIMYKDDEPITQIGNSSLIHLTGCFLNEINPAGFVHALRTNVPAGVRRLLFDPIYSEEDPP